MAVLAAIAAFSALTPNGGGVLSSLATRRAATMISASPCYDYVGTHRLSEKMLIKVFRRKDGLYARATGQAAIPIFASAPDEFFAKDGAPQSAAHHLSLQGVSAG